MTIRFPYRSAILAGSGFVALAAAPAWADAAKEVSTAAQHAGFAANAAEMKMVQMLLHHVVNCLVGPSGQGFDAGAGNPCRDQGNGAIADTTDTAKKAALDQALAKANAGLKQTDMAAAKEDATAVQALLKPAM